MADIQAQPASEAAVPAKASQNQRVSIAASAGTSVEPVLAEGRLGAPKVNTRVTEDPVLGPPQFFPANPAKTEELAQNKPLKQLTTSERTSSGGLLRTISDVITELRGKHLNKKRAAVGEANAGSPSQAKFRKKVEESTDSPSKAKVPALKSGASTGSPKRAGSGFSDKVPRMTCFGSSDGPVPEKKPSLAERYSAWKAKQAERRAARGSAGKAAPAANAKAPQTVIVSEKATAAEAEKVATTMSTLDVTIANAPATTK